MTEQADNLILGGKKLQLPYFSLNSTLKEIGENISLKLEVTVQ